MFIMGFLSAFYSRRNFEEGVEVHVLVIVVISFLIVKIIVDKINRNDHSHFK